jgi:exodeoxyribonuclease VII small subunit
MSRSADSKHPKPGAGERASHGSIGTSASADPRASEVPFDERLRALEAIAQELEQGELGLEHSIERYQQGVELLRTCHAQLALYQARVEELARDADPGEGASGDSGSADGAGSDATGGSARAAR